MKKRFDRGLIAQPAARTALAVALAAIAGAAVAVPGYVTSGSDTAVMSGSGSCWKTSDWTPDKAREPCDPVPRAAAPAPVESAQRAEPPAPAPIAAAPIQQPAPPVIQKLTLSTDVLFAFNKSDLREGGQQKLDELADRAKGADVDRVVVVGFADRIGSEEYNQQLSEKRAMAVKEYLAQKGVQTERVQAEGRGESDPVTGDQCKKLGRESARNSKLVACLQPDRRVDVELLGSREVASGASSTSGGSTSSGSSSTQGSSSR
jgi:OOP family OmpA-OmpF porin